MSLKEQTMELYQRYGLNETETEVYLVFLSYPQFTVSEVAGVLGKDEHIEEVQQIADRLEELNFIKKIPGVVDRYVPCEPYLELFTKESAKFRDEINRIKDEVLTDQSSRFENLEGIETKTVEDINSTVKSQVDNIVRESDNQDVQKKELIENAENRFSETSTQLMNTIQTHTFTARDKFEADRNAYTDSVKTKTEEARDRFVETAKTLQQDLQNLLFGGRDRFAETSRNVENDLSSRLNQGRERYETTSQSLEQKLHSHLDNQNSTLQQKIRGETTDQPGSASESINSELTTLIDAYTAKNKDFESEIHSTVDNLNQSLKKISEGFKSDYHDGIQSQKQEINKIMDDLLADFTTRVENLEKECKESLDDYVAFHKDNADNLKPELDEILEKNILRMKGVIDELKGKFSNLLNDHIATATKINENMRDKMTERVETRHSQLAGQVLEFKKNALELMDNLKDTSDRYTGLAEDLAKRGSAWKALLFGRHKEFKSNYQEIQERIGQISGEMKKAFEESTATYIQETGKTTTDLNQEITDITQEKNTSFKDQTESLDQEQQKTLDLQLEGIAKDLTQQTDGTIQKNVEGVEDTSGKLKDSLESTFGTHHEDFDLYLNKHRQTILDFDDTRNTTTKTTVDAWYKDIDSAHSQKKSELSNQIDAHLNKVDAHLNNSRNIYDKYLKDVDGDFAELKNHISDSITQEVSTIQQEVNEMDNFQKSTLDKQISLVNQEFESHNQTQLEKLKTEMDLFTQEVAEINQKQQEQVDTHIQSFKNIISELDQKQHTDIQQQIDLFKQETTQLEQKLHEMLENHKADIDQNTSNLQSRLVKTIETNIQDTKDAIADFTLTFMNSIDEADDLADENEEKLTDISKAAMQVNPPGSSSTWHVFGKKALLQAIIASMHRIKSTITIVSPKVEPKILEALSQVAYTKKSSRFLYTTNWDMSTYGNIIEKMKQLGNIQFRNLKSANDFFAVSRDGEEIILCPKSPNEEDMISIISMQQGYAQIFGSFIYPIFQANSRPI